MFFFVSNGTHVTDIAVGLCTFSVMYTSEELRAFNNYDVTPPRAVRKVILASGCGGHRVSASIHNVYSTTLGDLFVVDYIVNTAWPLAV